MQPFCIRTLATMMSSPTTNWRLNNGFRSSSGTAFQGMYFSSAFLDDEGFRVRFLDTVPASFTFVALRFDFSAFGISGPPLGRDEPHCRADNRGPSPGP